LNIGLGSGIFEKLCLESGIDIHTLDPDSEAILRISQELARTDKMKPGYSQSIPWPEIYFDVVVMSEVLEHLDDKTLDTSIREAWRVLKNGGRFIGTVPAHEDLRELTVVCPDCGSTFHRWGHLQSFDAGRLNNLLSESFASIRVNEQLFVSWNTLNWKGKFLSGIKYALYTLGVHGSGENLYFQAIK